MFNHTHYVPILRWKLGEKGALKQLRLEDRARLTPLIEWSRPSDVAPIGEGDAASEVENNLVGDILIHWGARPFFCDSHVLLRGHLGGDLDALRRVVGSLRDGGTGAIPVFWLADSPAYLATVRSLVPSAGMCLRLQRDDLSRPDLRSLTDRLVSSVGVEPQPSIWLWIWRPGMKLWTSKHSAGTCRHRSLGARSQLPLARFHRT